MLKLHSGLAIILAALLFASNATARPITVDLSDADLQTFITNNPELKSTIADGIANSKSGKDTKSVTGAIGEPLYLEQGNISQTTPLVLRKGPQLITAQDTEQENKAPGVFTPSSGDVTSQHGFVAPMIISVIGPQQSDLDTSMDMFDSIKPVLKSEVSTSKDTTPTLKDLTTTLKDTTSTETARLITDPANEAIKQGKFATVLQPGQTLDSSGIAV